MKTKVNDFICRKLEVKVPLPKDTCLQNYRYLEKGHLDSLALMKFIFEIEDHFDVFLEPEDTQSDEFRTIGGLVDIVAKKVKNNE